MRAATKNSRIVQSCRWWARELERLKRIKSPDEEDMKLARMLAAAIREYGEIIRS